MRVVLTAFLGLFLAAQWGAPAFAHENLLNFVNSRHISMPEGVRLVPASLTVSKNDMLCLALNDYWEARGESLRGRVAVAQVVLNRVRDPRFPNSICEVVSQNNSNGKACQFSWYCDGRPDIPTDKRAWRSSVLLAMSVLRRDSNVMDPTHGSLWFHTKAVSPSWSRQLDRTGRIDNHIFYTDNRAQRAPVLQTATRDLTGGSLVADLFADAGSRTAPAPRSGQQPAK